ncbi:transcriptional regulatory protein SrrA [Clostridium tepidiprofundi DSM 19306]|uniref:Stage 0 sporulation protein A homolog n=1 Tax=Clostridium tepidiprofundi DSM 19306 TaxID=1121338 RepID=A0A151ASM4_9CLOT|nr:response regulator transcription factor [Clostridium tepidiprofundi]KYH30626.1 transcriptional regulatory protein SrrA [Clostridium tepidiprofundi DSM 19306]
MQKNILIAEDDARMRKLLHDYLKKENFNIIEAENGKIALKKFKEMKIDLIILDVMMPELDGYSVSKAIREISDVPIIMLTAKSEEYDKISGFESGVDEYVTKPFSPKVLVARVKNLLQRVEGTLGKKEGIEYIDGLTINFLSHEVLINDEVVKLSPKEFDLLAYLVVNKGIALSRNTLLDNVWGYDYFGDLRTVDTHIKRLREKLKDKSYLITTVRGSGYKFEVKR